MIDAKAKVRKGTLFNRRILDPRVWSQRCALVEARLLAFVEQRQLSYCHIFLPIKRNNEFDTWPVVRSLHSSGVQVQISVSNFETNTMTHFVYTPSVNFELNAFDIPEPVDAQPADIAKLEMVLIPLLAADKKGNRIGYGKGFYDRLLAEMPQTVLKVGVGLSPLFDEFGFAEQHDVKLDYCITPQEIYHFHD